MSMMPSNEVIESALSHRVITLVYNPFLLLLPFPLHGTSSTCYYSLSGIHSVGNPLNSLFVAAGC